jgi:outer membrane scaffolding protein for murein synthesis (MipA/OmpV family)
MICFSRLYSAALNLLLMGMLSAPQAIVLASPNQQESKEKAVPVTSNIIGAGLGVRTSIFKNGDSTIIPNLLFDRGRLFIRGSLFGFRYYRSDDWSLDVGFNIESFGNQHDDSSTINALEGVDDVDKWVNSNLGAEYKLDSHRIRFDLSHDVSGEHGGSKLAFEYAHDFNFGRMKLVPFGGVEWWSNEITEHLFGVSVDSGDVPQHKPGSMLHGIVGFQVLYWVTPHHAVHLRVKQTLCDSAVNDSPLVATDQYTHSSLTYVYRF